MKINIDRDALFGAVAAAAMAVRDRSPLPALSCLRLAADADGQIMITGTDLEIWVREAVQCGVEEPGAVCLPARKLLEIVRELPHGLISMESAADSGHTTLSSGSARFDLATMPADDYPVDVFRDSGMVEAPAADILNAFGGVIFAASRDDSRFNFNGVLIERSGETINLVATDGHRLAMRADAAGNWFTGEKTRQVIPRSGVEMMVKFLAKASTCSVGSDGKYLAISTDSGDLAIRLLDGEYPDYMKVIPSPSTGNTELVVMNRRNLMAAARRCDLFTTDINKGVDITLTGGLLSMKAAHPDLGSACDELSVEYSGEQIDVILNSNYLMDALSHIAGDSVVVAYYGEGSPLVFRTAEDSGYLNLVMPMRK
jgi:DNA polymerase III subunit beta